MLMFTFHSLCIHAHIHMHKTRSRGRDFEEMSGLVLPSWIDGYTSFCFCLYCKENVPILKPVCRTMLFDWCLYSPQRTFGKDPRSRDNSSGPLEVIVAVVVMLGNTIGMMLFCSCCDKCWLHRYPSIFVFQGFLISKGKFGLWCLCKTCLYVGRVNRRISRSKEEDVRASDIVRWNRVRWWDGVRFVLWCSESEFGIFVYRPLNFAAPHA